MALWQMFHHACQLCDGDHCSMSFLFWSSMATLHPWSPTPSSGVMLLNLMLHNLYIVYILRAVCISVLHVSVLQDSASLVSVIPYPVLLVPVPQPPLMEVIVYQFLVVLFFTPCSPVAWVAVARQGTVTSIFLPPKKLFFPSLSLCKVLPYAVSPIRVE